MAAGQINAFLPLSVSGISILRCGKQRRFSAHFPSTTRRRLLPLRATSSFVCCDHSTDRPCALSFRDRILSSETKQHVSCRTFTTDANSNGSDNGNDSSTKQQKDESSLKLYLHLGPSGDCWIGRSIFAAKHNQPGYVKSVLLQPPAGAQQGRTTELLGERLVEFLQEHPKLAQTIFDTQRIPVEVWHQVLREYKDDDDDTLCNGKY